MILARRSFLAGLGAALITAPAIVRADSLMRVKQMMDDCVALTSVPHFGDGAALRLVDHPEDGPLRAALELNEQSLVDLLIEIKRPYSGLVLRPRFLHVP